MEAGREALLAISQIQQCSVFRLAIEGSSDPVIDVCVDVCAHTRACVCICVQACVLVCTCLHVQWWAEVERQMTGPGRPAQGSRASDREKEVENPFPLGRRGSLLAPH